MGGVRQNGPELRETPWYRVWAMADQEAPVFVQMGVFSTLLTQSPQKAATGPSATMQRAAAADSVPAIGRWGGRPQAQRSCPHCLPGAH